MSEFRHMTTFQFKCICPTNDGSHVYGVPYLLFCKLPGDSQYVTVGDDDRF